MQTGIAVERTEGQGGHSNGMVPGRNAFSFGADTAQRGEDVLDSMGCSHVQA